MVDFSKIINSTKLLYSLDKNLIKKFVDLTFENAKKYAKIIQKDIKVTTGHTIKINKINTAETGLLILGCSFGFVTNSCAFLTNTQGKKIEKVSKEIIKETFVESKYLIEKIDKYKFLYFKDKKYTYHPAGAFLEIFAQENVEIIYTNNPQILNPNLHKLLITKLLLMMMISLRIFNFEAQKKFSLETEEELLNYNAE
jgi:hypothetical protein